MKLYDLFKRRTSTLVTEPIQETSTKESSTYRFIGNDTVKAMVETALNGREYTCRVIRGGNTKVTFEYTLTDTMITINGDTIHPKIFVSNAERPGTALKFGVGILRLVCSNGMVAGTNFFSEKIIHRTGQTFEDKYEMVAEKIQEAVAYLEDTFASDMEEVVADSVTEAQAIEIIGNSNVPAKVKHEAIYRWFNPKRFADSQQDVWSLYNILNEAITDSVKSPQAKLAYNQHLLRDITDLKEAC